MFANAEQEQTAGEEGREEHLCHPEPLPALGPWLGACSSETPSAAHHTRPLLHALLNQGLGC